jgi:hypothetical protein
VAGGSWSRGRVLAASAGVAAAVALALVVALLVRGDGDSVLPSAGGDSPAPSATPTPAPSPQPPALSPFTGRPAESGRPVLGVKIDNVRPARPSTGVTKADIVYVEPVEGGLSRLLAVFSSRLPESVGPVRSARESDLELLRQFDHPALAFSGANRKVLGMIRDAPVTEVSPDTVGGAYERSRSRSAPHNLFADPRELLKKAEDVSPARDIGFRFGALPAGVGTKTTQQQVSYGAATTSFRWRDGGWQVSMDGRAATTTEGPPLAASTVVIQHVRITASRFRDSAGNVTPYTHTVGSGTAVVLRDGVAVKARWSRPEATSGTTFTTDTGAPLPFAPGQVWVVYADRSTA